MKTKKSVALLLALLTLPARMALGQTEWLQQFPPPPLSAVAFADSDHVVAVGGDRGALLQSTDGGQTWATLPVSTKGGLFDVFFVNSYTGYAVGEGVIWKTTDKGSTWTEQESGTQERLRGVCFTDEKTGTIVGDGVILRTTDGGASWKYQSSGTLQTLNVFRFLDDKVGTVFGSHGAVLRTTDAGMTWTNQASETPVSIGSISFAGRDTGFATDGYMNFLWTYDGGLTWHSEPFGFDTYFASNGIHFFNSRTGLLCGYNGLLRTTDAGACWIDQLPELKSKSVIPSNWSMVRFNDFEFIDTCYGFVVGVGQDDKGTMSGLILRTTDGGVHWQRQDKSGVTTELQRISFSDRQNGFATGTRYEGSSNAGIYVTHDSGATWSEKFLQYNAWLSEIININGKLALAIGSTYDNNSNPLRLVLKSTDGGGTWHKTTAPETGSVQSVAVVDSITLVACGWGGMILRSSDCGLTWSDVSGKVCGAFSDVYFSDADNGVAVGGGIVYRTTNGGADWRSQKVTITPQDGSLSFTRVCFVGADTGFAVSEDGLLLQTTDGGTSWQRAFAIQQANLHDISFVDRMDGLAIGSGDYRQHFLTTTDGGVSWVAHSDSSTNTLCGLAFGGAQKAIVVGYDASRWPNTGIILQKTSSGDSWTSRISKVGTLNDIVFTDREHGLALGSTGTILSTWNEGVTWGLMPSPTTKSLNSLCLTNGLTAIAVGDTGTIVRTTDGGLTWSTLASGTQRNLRKVVFRDDLAGVVLDDSGTILQTTDSGMSWVPHLLPSAQSMLNDLCLINDVTWIIVGSQVTIQYRNGNQIINRRAEIHRTTNSGASWSAVTFDTLGPLYGVCARGNGIITAVGPSLFALQSSDFGVSWAAIPIWPDNLWSRPTFYDVSFLDDMNGLAVGGSWGGWHAESYGVIVRTTDGGSSWLPDGNGLYTGFNWWIAWLPFLAIHWTDVHTATAVGGGGQIFRTINIEPTWIKRAPPEVPRKCWLSQNYPNPFNPTTVINYQLPLTTHISLKIYDLLGREVATLVNEVKRAGSYTVNWDASKHSSGVYFYRLNAGSFTDTKKLILLR